jgi:hypothetical protein
MPNPLYRGIISPLITPLTGRDTLDVGGLERFVNRLIDGGVAGIFALRFANFPLSGRRLFQIFELTVIE